jgi:plasmid stabilization system protein ParE
VTRPVQWSRHALDDLKRQIAYIAADNPGAARRIADRIRETVRQAQRSERRRPAGLGV